MIIEQYAIVWKAVTVVSGAGGGNEGFLISSCLNDSLTGAALIIDEIILFWLLPKLWLS